MKQKQKETVKIQTKKKRIFTLEISERTKDRISGYDKFGQFVILNMDDVESMIPIKSEEKLWQFTLKNQG